jgi:hypothetical protein
VLQLTVFIFIFKLIGGQSFCEVVLRVFSLQIEVRASEGRTLQGFLALYDEKKGIAIVTSFSLHYVYTMDTRNPVDMPGGTLNNDLCVFGRATDRILMGARCSHPVFKDKGVSTANCEITEVHSWICFLTTWHDMWEPFPF